MVKVLLFCLAFVLFACSDAGSPDGWGGFAIYTLQDSAIDARTALSYPIADLSLNPTPFLTAADFKTYRWANHTFELRNEIGAKWTEFQQRGGKASGIPFVITVGSQRIYVGTFWWAHSSMVPPLCAVIQVLGPYPYSISLQTGATDYRSDRRIYSALMAAGILVE